MDFRQAAKVAILTPETFRFFSELDDEQQQIVDGGCYMNPRS